MTTRDWGDFVLHHGDCLAVLPTLPADSVDAVVCDPPYHLTAARPGGRSEATRGAVMQGFMGMKWDGGDVAFRPETWAEVLRVMKPGAHLMAFGGTRTYHRLACAVEDAGFEIRDTIAWVFGSGFPKSHNGAWGGTALKPALEPVVVARKPLVGTVEANWLAYGTGALNIDGCRILAADAPEGRTRHGGGVPGNGSSYELPDSHGEMPAGRWPANLIHDGSDEVLAAFPDAPGQLAAARTDGAGKFGNVYSPMAYQGEHEPRNDAGSAARFFY